MTIDIRACCREYALAMTAQPSVTGTEDEVRFGPWLKAYLADHRDFAACERPWSIPVGREDPREIVFLLARGESDGPTVVLTGHYDTVTTEDYAELEHLALKPEELRDALIARTMGRDDAASQLAYSDLQGGAFLPGRGLLDMKGGLAAGLAAMASIIEKPFTGNVLFIAVPDEENASAGARAAVKALPAIAQQKNLEIRLIINLDATADVGDGSQGQVLATGTIGKILPYALVIGRAVHSGYATKGLNAAVCAAAIAARMEWAPELMEHDDEGTGTAATLLSFKDDKRGYDVTTPESAFLFWNVLFGKRHPRSLFNEFRILVATAVADCLRDLSVRLKASPAGDPSGIEERLPIWEYHKLLQEVEAVDPSVRDHLLNVAMQVKHLDFPEQSRKLSLELWRKSQLSGPAIIIGLGAPPYLSTAVTSQDDADILAAFVNRAKSRYGSGLGVTEFFQGISDMSFFGQLLKRSPETLAELCPPLTRGSSETNGEIRYPTVNLGPWGRDYHTPLERINVAYSFAVLPQLIADLTYEFLTIESPT